MVECRAGYVPIDYAINSSGFPLQATYVKNYSWEDLKKWVSSPTTAVIAYVPRHAVLVFAVGESSDGKYRHALIGRASGGQTPSSWIPFTEADAYEGEDLWYPGGTLGDKDLSGLPPLFIDGRHEAVIVERKKVLDYSPPQNISSYQPPSYMKSRELICNTCVLHKDTTDAKEHPKARKEWLYGE